MRVLIGIFLTVLSLRSIGQDSIVLTYKEYISIVADHHPVMFQSLLLDDKANNINRIARGEFDPKFEANWDHKSFDKKNYYSLVSGAVKIPTWYGIDLKGGFDRKSGEFLNESDLIPRRGLWSAGISIPLGKGLVIDKRRSALKKAKIYQSFTDQEQLLLINQLFYDASISYIEWQAAYAKHEIAIKGSELAKVRLEGIRQSFINGDKPAVDTLEAMISLQARQLETQKAKQILDNTIFSINNYLWIDGEVPLEIEKSTRPEAQFINKWKTQTDSLSLLQNDWLHSHPELLLYNFKIADINVDLQLANEELKPDIRLTYNPLIGVGDDAIFDQVNSGNYKLGATISYPILQNKQRGKIALNKIKVLETEYDMVLKKQDLTVKLNTYINNVNQTEEQYKLLAQTVSNYESLLIAENRKLSFGESSIFLVNSRENKYLESSFKKIEAFRKVIFNRLTYILHSARLEDIIFYNLK